MATIAKLKSGNYRVQVRGKGLLIVWDSLQTK